MRTATASPGSGCSTRFSLGPARLFALLLDLRHHALPGKGAGVIVEEQMARVEKVRERGFVLNPQLALDDQSVVPVQLKWTRAKASALEVPRLLRKDSEKNELSVSVLQSGL